MFASAARSTKRILGFLALGLLAGCGGRATAPNTPPMGTSQAVQLQTQASTSRTSTTPTSAQLIYTSNGGNNTVTAYTLPNLSGVVQTITNGLNAPNAIAVDANGRLYVANQGSANNQFATSITVYNPGGNAPVLTITPQPVLGNLFGLAVNNGKIYVATQSGTISAYVAASGAATTPSITVGDSGSNCCIAGLAADSSGNIYVTQDNEGTVTRYTPAGATFPFPKPIGGLIGPGAITIDASGKIYVTSVGPYGNNPSVTTYESDGTPTTPTITTGFNGNDPEGIAVDNLTGKIYVADTPSSSCYYAVPGCGYTVSTYDANGTLLSQTPTVTGLDGTFNIALRPRVPPSLLVLANLSDNIYDGNAGYGGYNFIGNNCTLTPTCTNFGLAAGAYANQGNSEIVIAIRGTILSAENTDTVLETLSNLDSDIRSFGGTNPSSTLIADIRDAAAFVQTIQARYPQANITLTGHSLGGGIAQLLSQASNLSAYTFNAPGGERLYNNLHQALSGFSVAQNPSYTNVNYRLYDEQISLIGTPVGSTITLQDPPYLVLPSAGILSEDLPCRKLVNEVIPAIAHLHSMNTMLAQITDNAPQVSSAGEPNFIPLFAACVLGPAKL